MIEVRIAPGGSPEVGVWVPLGKIRFAVDAFTALLRDRRPTAQLADFIDWLRSRADAAADVAAHIADGNARSIARQPDSPDYRPYDLLDTAEAAAICGVTGGGVRDLARRGRLPAHRAGGRWLFPAVAVVAYAERRAARR